MKQIISSRTEPHYYSNRLKCKLDKLRFAPYIGTLFFFLIYANLWGLIGLRPPTADVNTTFALSIITFFLIHFFGIKSKGI